MDIKIAVIIPSYNRAGLIGETLCSVLEQSLRPAEVIVVDDGSTDATEGVVREFRPGVRYLRIDNSGECRARNVGVDASTAPWIAFCDSDDLWRSDKLERQARLVQQDASIGYSFTNFQTVNHGAWSEATKFDSSPQGYWEVQRRNAGPEGFIIEEPMCARLLRHQPVFPSTLLMQREFFENVGRWREPLGRTPSVDLEFHFRCAAKPPIGVVSAPVVGIRKHSANFSGNVLKTALGEIEVLRYILANNSSSREYASLIQREIVRRSAAAAAGSFTERDLEQTRNLLKAVPYGDRSWKLQIKSIIATSAGVLGLAAKRVS